MNEHLQQALSDILNKTVAGVEAGTNFLAAEIPEVIQQLLMWKLVESSFFLLVSLAILIVSSVFIVKNVGTGDRIDQEDNSYRNHKITLTHDADGDVAPWIAFSWMVIFIPGISICSVIESTKIALQIWLAPKIYLIEYAASLVK